MLFDSRVLRDCIFNPIFLNGYRQINQFIVLNVSLCAFFWNLLPCYAYSIMVAVIFRSLLNIRNILKVPNI